MRVPSDVRGPARLQLAIDALALIAAMALALLVQPALVDVLPGVRELVALPELRPFTVLAGLLFLYLVTVFGTHRSGVERWSPAETLGRLVMLHLAGLGLIATVAFLTNTTVNRSLVGLVLLFSLLFMAVQRAAFGLWAGLQYARAYGRRTYLVVGRPSARLDAFLEAAGRGREPPRFLGRLGPSAAAATLPYLGEVDALAEVLHARAVDEVLFFPPYHRPEERTAELETCEDLGVSAHFLVELGQVSRARPRLAERFAHPTVTFDPAERSQASLAIKHALDPILALAVLAVTWPVLLAAAAAIVLTDGFPVFFVQERAGLQGRPFRMVKLRTMRRGAETRRAELEAHNEMSGPVFKIAEDPRVTPVGAFLRRASIDELPQLFNVLGGTMSLVGPRPLPLGEQQRIRGVARRRLSMKPGITCLWQVSGRSDVDFEDWMLLDLRYVDAWSLWLDVTILLRTIPAVLFRRGAK